MLTIPGWSIELSLEKTLRYYDSLVNQKLCTCEDCVWFRFARATGRAPVLQEFLRLFGIDFMKESDSRFLYDEEDSRYFNPRYVFFGKIVGKPNEEKDSEGHLVQQYHKLPTMNLQYLILDTLFPFFPRAGDDSKLFIDLVVPISKGEIQ